MEALEKDDVRCVEKPTERDKRKFETRQRIRDQLEYLQTDRDCVLSLVGRRSVAPGYIGSSAAASGTSLYLVNYAVLANDRRIRIAIAEVCGSSICHHRLRYLYTTYQGRLIRSLSIVNWSMALGEGAPPIITYNACKDPLLRL